MSFDGFHSLTQGASEEPLVLPRPLGWGRRSRVTRTQTLALGTRGLMRGTGSATCCPGTNKSHQRFNDLEQFLLGFRALGGEDRTFLRSGPQQLGFPEGSTGRGVMSRTGQGVQDGALSGWKLMLAGGWAGAVRPAPSPGLSLWLGLPGVVTGSQEPPSKRLGQKLQGFYDPASDFLPHRMDPVRHQVPLGHKGKGTPLLFLMGRGAKDSQHLSVTRHKPLSLCPRMGWEVPWGHQGQGTWWGDWRNPAATRRWGRQGDLPGRAGGRASQAEASKPQKCETGCLFGND